MHNAVGTLWKQSQFQEEGEGDGRRRLRSINPMRKLPKLRGQMIAEGHLSATFSDQSQAAERLKSTEYLGPRHTRRSSRSPLSSLKPTNSCLEIARRTLPSMQPQISLRGCWTSLSSQSGNSRCLLLLLLLYVHVIVSDCGQSTIGKLIRSTRRQSCM